MAAKVACINGVIGDLAGQDQLAALERGMRTLTDGIVLPAAVKTDAQRIIITGFMSDQQDRANGIAALIAAVEVPVIEPVSADMPNRMAGVWQHWQSLISLVPAKHESLVSYATFQLVQERLKGTAYAPARKDISEDFPLRGFITCACCDKPLTACWSKGRTKKYPYYLCKTKHPLCRCVSNRF